MKYTKDSLVGEVLDNDESLARYILEMGMQCLGCPSSRGETIEQACEVHGADCARLLEQLNGTAL